MYVCMFICMYVCMYVSIYLSIYLSMYPCIATVVSFTSTRTILLGSSISHIKRRILKLHFISYTKKV